MPRAQRYGTEDAIEVFSGMLFEWIRCQPQKRMPGHGAEDLSVLFERIMHCKQNLPAAASRSKTSKGAPAMS
jgi:hypothetical protein